MSAVAAEPLRCQELVELVTEYLEGGLSPADRRRFRRHIMRCMACAAYLEQIRMTIRASGTITPETLDPRARDELLEAFRGWKRG